MLKQKQKTISAVSCRGLPSWLVLGARDGSPSLTTSPWLLSPAAAAGRLLQAAWSSIPRSGR
jgi:hypothetical protein